MLYPAPPVLISCADEEGNANIMTAAWAGTVCSDPVMVSVSIRPSRYSHGMISRTGEFVINLPTEKLAYAVDYCGVRSGREIDKFEHLKLTRAESRTVKAPSIGESPVSLECRVTEIRTLLRGRCMSTLGTDWVDNSLRALATPAEAREALAQAAEFQRFNEEEEDAYEENFYDVRQALVRIRPERTNMEEMELFCRKNNLG